MRNVLNIKYLKSLLRYEVAPMVDVISYHPLYGNRPDDPYYQNYPQMVEEIKKSATFEGFEGEYLVEEIVWRTPGDSLDPHLPRESEVVATKYFVRSIIMSRGLNLIVSIALPGAHDPTLLKVRAIHNTCDIMAGAEPISLPVEIQSESTNIRYYSFSRPNGDKLVALWTDSVAVDEDSGVKTNLTFNGFTTQDVMGIDVLKGFQQSIKTSNENGNLIIQDLIVRDYPLILHITKPSIQ